MNACAAKLGCRLAHRDVALRVTGDVESGELRGDRAKCSIRLLLFRNCTSLKKFVTYNMVAQQALLKGLWLVY